MSVLRRSALSGRFSFLLILSVLVMSGLLAGCAEGLFPTEYSLISVQLRPVVSSQGSGEAVADEPVSEREPGLATATQPDARLAPPHNALRMALDRSQSHIVMRY